MFDRLSRNLRLRIQSLRRDQPRMAGLLAVLVGLALRWWSVQRARFSAEESWFWSVGRDIATGSNFPVLGHPISGTSARHPGAAFFWLLGLTQLPGPSPLRAYAMVSFAGLLVVVPLAVAISKAFDRETGLAFLILSALSPWWIVYTNSAWPSYLTPTLCSLLIAWLPSLAGSPRPRLQAALIFLLVIGFQIHLSALHYCLIALVTFIVWRPKLTRPMAIGLILGCLCYLPYLVYEARTGFANTIAIAHRSQGEARSLYRLQGLLLYFLGFTTTDLSYLWNQGFWFPFDLVRFWRGAGVAQTQTFFQNNGLAPIAWLALVASWILTGISWLYFARALWRRLRVNALAAANVVPFAFLTGVGGIVLLYALSGKGGYPHYVSTILPLAFLPPAFLIGRMFKHRIARWGAGFYICLFTAGGLLGLRGYYAVDSRWSVQQTTAAVAFILDRTKSPEGQQLPFQLTFGFGPNWPSSYRLIAQYVFHKPFLATDVGARAFRIDLRGPGDVAELSERNLILPSITVHATARE